MTRTALKLALTLLVAQAGLAHAAVPPEEAKQLGSTLTPFGAEKAGNKDGTIPEYTGGVTTPPKDFKPGSGLRPNPFKDERPLFTITSVNADQYGDKLSDGVKAMLKRYPSYRLDVYPTHRSVAFPKYVLEGTVANATRAKTTNGGEGLEGAWNGFPFPIPKTGHEAMWNHLLRYVGHAYTYKGTSYYVDASGTAVLNSVSDIYSEFPYYEPKNTKQPDMYWILTVNYTGPARLAGQATMLQDAMDLTRKAYVYQPGQRRVRLAPEMAYDAPISSNGGGCTYDDMYLFSGRMDRFDFKLLGKREVFIPYNSYKSVYECTTEELLKYAKAHHSNPGCERWELHRVWVVEAKLKPGKRHVYSRRVFYFDEDSWIGGVAENYDPSGKLYRVSVTSFAPSYDVPAPDQNQISYYDLISGVFTVSAANANGYGIRQRSPRPPRELTPEAFAGAGVR
jgi:hypothetical protein